jgi:hypothetical protein
MTPKRYIALLTLFLAGVGCATGGGRPDTFSPTWAEDQRQQRERVERLRDDGEGIVLLGDPADPKARIYRDEKGRPRLGLGGKGRVSADVNPGKFLLKYNMPLMRAPKRFPGVPGPAGPGDLVPREPDPAE